MCPWPVDTKMAKVRKNPGFIPKMSVTGGQNVYICKSYATILQKVGVSLYSKMAFFEGFVYMSCIIIQKGG